MKNLLLLASLLIAFNLLAQSGKQFFGPRLTNTALYLDPTELMVNASITSLPEKALADYQYIPFAFGFSQSLWGKQMDDGKAWEVFAELGTFTQFEWKIVDGEQQRNLINTDYKAAISYARKVSEKFTYRLRFFHVSSHLGDDFIIRNGINKFSENKVNYEQLEFSVFYHFEENLRINAGVGSVVRPNAKRLPFSFHLGADHNWKKNDRWGISSGFLIKGMQEHAFQASGKVGVGPAFFSKHKAEPIRLLLEYYEGHLPYSQFEANETKWYGLGLYFYL